MPPSEFLHPSATIDDVGAIRRAVASASIARGADEDMTSRVALAVSELCVNAMTHGSDTGEITVHVRVCGDGDELVIDVADDAAAFDPRPGMARRTPDPSASATHGGLGLVLVGADVDDVVYTRINGRNQLRFTVRRRTSPSSGRGCVRVDRHARRANGNA